MVLASILLVILLALMIIGSVNNQADWGHWATNILDGLIRVYCRSFHRQKDSVIQIPKDQSILLAANHVSGIDPFILITATRRPIRFMIAKEEYEKPILHWMFRAAGCIPVDRQGRVEGAFRRSLRAIKNGELVAVFPQGGIHSDEKPRRMVKPGIVKLSEMSQCSVLPVRICGVGAPGNIARSVITRSHIDLETHPLINPEKVKLDSFKKSLALWLLGETNEIT